MSSSVIKELVESFHTALEAIKGPTESSECLNKVKDSTEFNNIIQRCILNLPNELYKFLKLSPDVPNDQAHKSKRFPKVKSLLKTYLKDVIEILKNVTSKSILKILLKHLHEILRFTSSFSSLIKPLLKVLLRLWSGAEAEVRVVAFRCILRLACQNNKSNLEIISKMMYIKYVENSKFVSPSTLPGINFMRRSLVEIYLLDSELSYNHAFLYIRQLAIQLRNAVTLKKKENYQAVYNWQFINSLKFWSELLSTVNRKSVLNQLIYPLVQIINTTITLIPTAQYYPLRFHCVQMLTDISRDTGIFIPTLPYIIEILINHDFNKKHSQVSMKPLSMTCLLRVSKSQMKENGFKNSIIENVYRLILENAEKDSCYIYFPELYTHCVIQMKEFLKKNNVASFGKQIKQLLNKIEENSKFLDAERGKVTLDLKNIVEIKNWENRIRVEGTPVTKFYNNWKQVYEEKLKIMAANTEESENTDTSKQKHSNVRMEGKNKKRRMSHVDESDEELPKELVDKLRKKEEKSKAKKKKRKIMINETTNIDINDATGNADVVKDIKLDDWD